MARKTFNCRLSPDERARLDKLAIELGITPADAMRLSVKMTADLMLPKPKPAKADDGGER